jgi:Protein of unknown function (DUF2867).
MRLPNTAHTSRPWRIHELTRDFQLEDVWALPTPGGRDDFPRLVQLMATFDLSQSSSGAVRTLFAIRWRIGAPFGWDRAGGHRSERATLRERLPEELREAPSRPGRAPPHLALPDRRRVGSGDHQPDRAPDRRRAMALDATTAGMGNCERAEARRCGALSVIRRAA